MIISVFDIQRLVQGEGWLTLDLAALLVGATPPSRVLSDIRDADPSSARRIVATWRGMGTELDETATTLDLDLVRLDAAWTGHAADAAQGYLRRLGTGLRAVGMVVGQLAEAIDRSIEAVLETKRAEQQAADVAVREVQVAALSTLAAVVVALAFPAALAAILAAFAAFLVSMVGAFAAFLHDLYRMHRERTDALRLDAVRVGELVVVDRLVAPVVPSTPALDRVVIVTGLVPPPVLPPIGPGGG